jgi:hypothetical protein
VNTADVRRALAQDWVLWGALGCALVGTAHSEWSLAVSIGAHPWIAAAVPGALDLYVIRALQLRRDVFLAVLAMVAANVAWYLVHSGDLPIGWQLRSAVAAVAPLVVWRVHSLKHTRTRAELLWDTEAGAVSAPASAVADAPAPVLNAPEVRALIGECAGDDECTCEWCAPPTECGESGAPDYVPFDWSASPGVHLKAVPDLPPAFDPVSAAHSFPDVVHLPASAPLKDGDAAHLPGAREYLDNCAKTDTDPSARGLASALRVGQARAGRLLRHLTEEET